MEESIHCLLKELNARMEFPELAMISSVIDRFINNQLIGVRSWHLNFIKLCKLRQILWSRLRISPGIVNTDFLVQTVNLTIVSSDFTPFSSSLFFYAHYFSSTSGILRKLSIFMGTHILTQLDGICKKYNIFLNVIFGCFFCFLWLCSVTEPGRILVQCSAGASVPFTVIIGRSCLDQH